MKDYLDVEYNPNSKAFTDYPDKLAKYLFKLCGMKPGQTLLEVGAGRCEMARAFSRLGISVYVVDTSPQFIKYAEEFSLSFRQAEWKPNSEFRPFEQVEFDYVFTKSFIEHISQPLEFVHSMKKLLKRGGKLLTLTPDFEANWWNFFDDFTHIKPFTARTLDAVYNSCEFVSYDIFKIRQLPSTWKSNIMLFLSKVTAILTPTRLRTTNKWLRWSRELMLVGIAEK